MIKDADTEMIKDADAEMIKDADAEKELLKLYARVLVLVHACPDEASAIQLRPSLIMIESSLSLAARFRDAGMSPVVPPGSIEELNALLDSTEAALTRKFDQ